MAEGPILFLWLKDPFCLALLTWFDCVYCKGSDVLGTILSVSFHLLHGYLLISKLFLPVFGRRGNWGAKGLSVWWKSHSWWKMLKDAKGESCTLTLGLGFSEVSGWWRTLGGQMLSCSQLCAAQETWRSIKHVQQHDCAICFKMFGIFLIIKIIPTCKNLDKSKRKWEPLIKKKTWR